MATANGADGTLSMFSMHSGGWFTKVGLPHSIIGSPSAVTFSRDGRLIASANQDANSASLFFVTKEGELIDAPAPPAETGSVPSAVAFSRDSKLLATANSEGDSVSVFRVSDAGLSKVPGPAVGTGDGPASVAFSPVAGLLATANRLGDSVSLFSVAADGALTILGQVSSRGDAPASVAFSPDGSLLAVANEGGDSVSVFAVANNALTPLFVPSKAGDAPRSVAFTPNGHHVVTANHDDQSLSTFTVAGDGELTPLGPPVPATGSPGSVAFGLGGTVVATANEDDDTVSTFSVSARGWLTPTLPDVEMTGYPNSVTINRDGDLLVTSHDFDNLLSVFRILPSGALTPVGPPIPTPDHVRRVVFNPSGDLLVAEGWTGVTIYKVSESGALTPASGPQPTDLTGRVAFSRDGTWLAANDAQGVVLRSVSPDGQLTPGPPTGLPHRGVAFSPVDDLLVATDWENDTLAIYRVTGDGELISLGPSVGTDDGPLYATFNPTGDLLAVANYWGNTLSVYSLDEDGQPTRTDTVPVPERPTSPTFSPDGQMLAVVDEEHYRLYLFDVRGTGHLNEALPPTLAGGFPSGLAFTPNGRSIAVSKLYGNTVSMYSLAAPALDTAIASAPPKATKLTSATFQVEANYPGTLECKEGNGDTWFSCDDGSALFLNLADGEHSFEVRATDLTGATDPTPAVWKWTVDRMPPAPQSLSFPLDGETNLRSDPLFEWWTTSDETGIDSYELLIDGVPSAKVPNALCNAVCSTRPDPLADGQHTWQVRAVDNAGNPRLSETRSFSVDAAPPSPFALTGPAEDAATTDRRPTLTWEATTDAGVGLSGYVVELDGKVVAKPGPSATSYTPAADLPEGPHQWKVVAHDAFDHERESTTRRFTVDVTPPTAALGSAPNPSLAGHTVTFDGAASADAASGIARYEWDLDGGGTFERDSGGVAGVTRIYPDQGTFEVRLRVTDRVGLSSTARIDQRVTVDKRGRAQAGISINDGARYTNDPKVMITAQWPSFAGEMLISNDGGFKLPMRTFGPRTSTPWTLDSSGAERLPKIVYVRFARGLTVSETFTDDIILDERAPLIKSALVSPAKGKHVLVRLRARDRGLAGLKAVQATNDRRHPKASFHRYRAAVTVKAHKGERPLKLGKPIFVRVRDRAGNLSPWRVAQRAR